MPLFDVTFEDVGFLTKEELSELELSESELAGFTATSIEEGTFPEGVVGVMKASWSPDDSVHEGGKDEEGDIKVFVSITLRVEAEDEDEADYMDAPVGLLTKVTDMLSTEIDLEGNWENTRMCDVVEDQPQPTAA